MGDLGPLYDRSPVFEVSATGVASVSNPNDVRISVAVEVGGVVRHFEVHGKSFEETYAELVKRLTLAGYVVGARRVVAGTAT